MSESLGAILISVGVGTILSILGYLLKKQHDSALCRIADLEDRMREHHEATHLEIAEDLGILKERTKRCKETESK